MDVNNEEKYIRERFGKNNPFTVPEGYFEQLASDVMSQIPERRAKSSMVALRPWLYAAACLVAVTVMTLTFHFRQDHASEVTAQAVESVDNSYIEEAADYVMLDNAEIYACLADN